MNSFRSLDSSHCVALSSSLASCFSEGLKLVHDLAVSYLSEGRKGTFMSRGFLSVGGSCIYYFCLYSSVTWQYSSAREAACLVPRHHSVAQSTLSPLGKGQNRKQNTLAVSAADKVLDTNLVQIVHRWSKNCQGSKGMPEA